MEYVKWPALMKAVAGNTGREMFNRWLLGIVLKVFRRLVFVFISLSWALAKKIVQSSPS